MKPIEIEFGRTVIETFWTLNHIVQKELLISAIRGAQRYSQSPNKEWYHGIISVEGYKDLLDVTYHNPSQSILWENVGQPENPQELINCGERNIQRQYRIVLRDICERYGIKEGDAVEVYILVVKK